MGGPRVVQWSRFSDSFGRLFGLQGDTALNVVDDCFLTLPVELDAEHLDYLRGWKNFGGSFSCGAVAGQLSAVRLINQAVLAVVTGVYFAADVATDVSMGVTVSAAAPTANRTYVRDSRQAGSFGNNQSPLTWEAVNGAAPSLTIPQWRSAAPSTMHRERGWFVLAPGSTLWFETSAVLANLRVSVLGAYREMTPQES